MTKVAREARTDPVGQVGWMTGQRTDEHTPTPERQTPDDERVVLDIEATVVVPTHHGAHRLPQLLEALSRQTFDGAWELIVVIDGAVDNTEVVLDRFEEKLPLQRVRHKEARGVSAAMNAGLRASRGRIVIRCDDDLTPSPQFIERHLEHHLGPDVGVIGPTRDIFTDTAYARAYGRPANERSLAAAYARPEAQRWIGWAANNSAPRERLLGVGGFDETLPYGEDSELGYRLYQAGVRIVVDPNLETPHRGPATNTATRVPRAFISGASRRAFISRHPEALPADNGTPTTVAEIVWDAAIRATASGLRRPGQFRTAGALIDLLLPGVPRPIARKLVAWLVESAGLAGRRFGDTELHKYRSQKDDEVRRELEEQAK